MKKNKIAFCIPFMIIGGVETVFLRTLDELYKNKFLEIVILTHLPLNNSTYSEWFCSHPDIKIYTYYPLGEIFEKIAQYTKIFPLKNIRKIIFSLYKKYRRILMTRRIRKYQIDLFIDYKNCAFARELRHIKAPKITWIHGSINYFNLEIKNKHLDFYDKFICLSDSFANDFSQSYPKYAKKIVRIYNPIKINAIRRAADSAPTCKDQYFCTVSRLNQDKDVETIIRAFDKFWQYENQPNVKLLIIGGGKLESKLKRIAASLPAHLNIKFTGSEKNPFGYMRGAIAHILSSYNEGLPTVLIESAAVGTLNISSDCKSGPREILMDGRAGILFTPGDENQLARILSDVWNNRVPISNMIRNANVGLKRFNAKKITNQIINMITGIVYDGTTMRPCHRQSNKNALPVSKTVHHNFDQCI